jgi:hypothetical protein
MFNIYLGIYIIVAIVTIAGGTYSIVNTGKSLAAVLFFIGVLVVFVVFGIKWFSRGAVFAKTPVSWPPTINTCPDYLVHYGRTMPDGGKQDACIDLIGVSKNGKLKMFPKDGAAASPVDNDYYFSLLTKSADTNAKNQELCQRAIDMGLTWEGITNGESCISAGGSAAAGDDSGGTGGCPK